MLSVPPLAIVLAFFGVFIMRPVARGSVNKSRSVCQFRKNSARTKRANVRTSTVPWQNTSGWCLKIGVLRHLL